MRLSLFSSALVAALVGYGSTIALLLAAAATLGASPAQSGSWVFAICISKAICSAWLSFRSRVPVILAWSTPGLALIAASEDVTMAQAVGAFILAGGLIALTGAWRSLGDLVAKIPDAIAAGMLAGVLLPFCLPLPQAAVSLPFVALPMIAIFTGVRLVNPAFAVLAALAIGAALTFWGPTDLPQLTASLPRFSLIWPEFTPGALIGLGLPLYLVTMASQNLPGFAVLRAAGYTPPLRPALITTGAASMLTAFAGAHTISMAAITAAICLGPDTHPDKDARWKVGLCYGAVWLCLGLAGPLIIPTLATLPPSFITVLVGLALLGPLLGAATAAFATPDHRFAALVTLVVTASGFAAFGIGAAFWGLLAGLSLHLIENRPKIRPHP